MHGNSKLVADPAALQVSVTEQLLDRLEDVKRTFPTAVILGGAGNTSCPRQAAHTWTAVLLMMHRHKQWCWLHSQPVSGLPAVGEQVARGLAGGRAGIQRLLHLEMSASMLARAQQAAGERTWPCGRYWQQPNVSTHWSSWSRGTAQSWLLEQLTHEECRHRCPYTAARAFHCRTPSLFSLPYSCAGTGPCCFNACPAPSYPCIYPGCLQLDSCPDLRLHPLGQVTSLLTRPLLACVALPAGRCADSCPDLAQRAPCRPAPPCPQPPMSRQMRSTCPSRRRALTVRLWPTAA